MQRQWQVRCASERALSRVRRLLTADCRATAALFSAQVVQACTIRVEMHVAERSRRSRCEFVSV